MHIKTIPPISVLYFSTTTTLREAGQFAIVIAQKLYKEAARQDVLPAGPVYWLYYQCNGEMDDPFTLEIALPLSATPTETGEFAFKELPSFQCVSFSYEGPWNKIFEAYDQVIGWTKSNGYQLTDEFREAYIYLFNNYQVTEINVGIK